jgi:hypothetical protein
MSSWTMSLIMKLNGEFPTLMPCRYPKSKCGRHQLCYANGNGQVSWLKSGSSYCMPSIHICCPYDISVDDSQLQSILHIDITQSNYWKKFGHGHYTEHQSCGRQMMRRQCPQPPSIRSLPITYSRHICNCWLHYGGMCWCVLYPTPCCALFHRDCCKCIVTGGWHLTWVVVAWV